jgi:alpha-mannosidase
VLGGSLHCGKLHQWFDYEIKFGASKLKVTVTLKKGSKMLEFEVQADWHELPVRHEVIPQLNFAVPVNGAGETVFYDIPYGVVEREQLAHDVPALSYLSMNGVGLIADCKYGFRCYDDVGSVTLIRTSYNPDPYPDQGKSTLRLAVAAASNGEMKDLAEEFCHPLPFASATCHQGTLPLESSLLQVEGARVACLKIAEDNSGTVVRLYNPAEEAADAVLTAREPLRSAILTDSTERPVQSLEVEDRTLRLSVPARSVLTVKLQ